MSKRSFQSVNHSSHRHFGKATVICVAILMFLNIGPIPVRHVSSQGLQRKQPAEIAGVRFAVPQGFELEQGPNDKFALMRNGAKQIALFVTVPDRQVDDKYLTDLSTDLASRLLPKQQGFEWKISQRAADRATSQYQTKSGTTKGLSGKSFVQTDYVVVKAQGRDVLIGSIATFGEAKDAKVLFDVDGREYSVEGWQALFHLIASVTGENTTKEVSQLR